MLNAGRLSHESENLNLKRSVRIISVPSLVLIFLQQRAHEPGTRAPFLCHSIVRNVAMLI